MSKKLEQKQQRRLAEERRKAEAKREQRKKNLVTILVAGVVVALVAFLVVSDRRAAEGPVGVAAEEAGCGDIEDLEATGNGHLEPGAPPPDYNSNPPTSGPHDASPFENGFFETPADPVRLVHNLEHGQIVFWYAPDAPDEIKQDLEAVVEREPAASVAVPYDGATDYNFYMAAWNKLPSEPEEAFGTGYLQGCDAVSQEVVDNFRREHQGKSPEPITPPFRG